MLWLCTRWLWLLLMLIPVNVWGFINNPANRFSPCSLSLYLCCCGPVSALVLALSLPVTPIGEEALFHCTTDDIAAKRTEEDCDNTTTDMHFICPHSLLCCVPLLQFHIHRLLPLTIYTTNPVPLFCLVVVSNCSMHWTR